MAVKVIERVEKNQMRKQLEEILELEKSITEKIDIFQKDTKEKEYKDFWNKLKEKKIEHIQSTSSYMVKKCNR